MYEKYESPLSSRYASDYMLHLFSQETRIQTWRSLWVALARAEHKLGLPITAEQVAQLEAHVNDIDFDCAAQREKEVRHDVMAHVYAYGKAAPSATGIIHLGATSCYVTDNGDLILYRDGLRYLRGELLGVWKNLAAFADEYKAMPTLGYTHYQPAQLVTVGKRATLWMQDFLSDLEELDHVLDHMKFLGCRGTTGTEASFMDLFEGDTAKIDEMNRQISAEFGFDRCFDVCGQTYPRKVDSRILNCLSSIAQSAYRMANDIRLLQHDRQLEEPFEKNQIGSSAMAYKRNPMRSERICSLARYVTSDALNPALAVLIPTLFCLVGSLLMGLLFCFLTVTLRANQNVTGLAMTTFGVGFGNFFGGNFLFCCNFLGHFLGGDLLGRGGFFDHGSSGGNLLLLGRLLHHGSGGSRLFGSLIAAAGRKDRQSHQECQQQGHKFHTGFDFHRQDPGAAEPSDGNYL